MSEGIMGDAIQSFLADYEQNDPSESEPRARCCCGSEACAFLKHNQTALDGLEKDVSTAARLGKALLMRHETYIADSERDRRAMTAQIETLEMEKALLERKNAATIQENRLLLDQLESINAAVGESDALVLSLQATLHSTQLELQKLQGLTTRTANLERQIADFEQEQTTWHTSLEAKTQSEKSALRRCHIAERTLAELQDQIERIEREAREEQLRHTEIVERMERRHAVERELGSAAGRLKGAAALKSNGAEAAGPNVVSHFVKDILQDNANLQMGIVELRDMLNTSNEEVENLRDQLSLHQPAEESEAPAELPARRSDLRNELTRANSQEVHVHHHYHVPSNAPKSLRRKKKAVMGHYTPSSGTATPRSSFSHTPRSSFSHPLSTPTAAILQQTAASIPQSGPDRNRWSSYSNQTYASLASSPQSTSNRTSSLFERVFSDGGLDSSRPTTPDTEDFGSPIFGPSHYRKSSSGSFRTFSAPVVPRRTLSPTGIGHTLESIMSIEELPKFDLASGGQDTIPEESEADWENTSSGAPEDGSGISSPTPNHTDHEILGGPIGLPPPPLRRTASHESVFSVAAMDIHTLKSRPSQLLGPYHGRGITSEAVISDTVVHATRPAALTVRSAADSRNLLNGMAVESRPSSRPTLGRKVGSWVFGKWGGAAPVSSPASTAAVAKPPSVEAKTVEHKEAPSISSASVKSGDAPQIPVLNKTQIRSPGINQMGPILGFGPEVKIQHAPVMKTLDEEALRRALGDE